jgi:hypothetical protein
MRTVGRAVLLALLLTLLLWTSSAWAITYSYVGDTFRANIAESIAGVYTLSDYIRGWVTVNDSFVPPLQAHEQNMTLGVLSYSFTDGHQTLTEANSTGGFMLPIQAPVLDWSSTSGSSAWWFVGITTPTSGIRTSFSVGRTDQAFIGPDNHGGNFGDFAYNDGSHKGVWTVPEPAPLVLLVAGLLVLSASLSRGRARS